MQSKKPHFFIMAFSFLLFISSGCSSVSREAKDMVSRPAPYVRLTLLDGTQVPLEYVGKRSAAIMFWAAWCKYSRSAIAEFEELRQRYNRKGNVEFIAVSIDKAESLEGVKARIAQQKTEKLTHAFSGNDIQDEAFLAFHAEDVPFFVFIDSSGIVRGVSYDVSDLEDFIESSR